MTENKNIITGIESRSTKPGEYRSTLLLSPNATAEQVKELVELLAKQGVAAYPAQTTARTLTGWKATYKRGGLYGYGEKSQIENHNAGENPKDFPASMDVDGKPAELAGISPIFAEEPVLALKIEGPDGKPISVDKESALGAASLHDALNQVVSPFFNTEALQARTRWLKFEKPVVSHWHDALSVPLQNFLQTGTQLERYNKAMALYAVGDVTGTLNGALINHDMHDAAFAAAAGFATALGYAGNSLEEPKSIAEKVRDQASGTLPVGSYPGGIPSAPQGIKDGAVGLVAGYGKDVFNIANWSSFLPLFQAGLSQKSAPKMIAGGLGLTGWAIRSLIPQKGYSGLVDMEKVTDTLGLNGVRDSLNRNAAGKVVVNAWDEIRNDPARISGALNKVRNVFMYLVTAWDWTISPANMYNIENKYTTGEENREKTTFTQKLQNFSNKVVGFVLKKPKPVDDPKRFHQCDESGKVTRHWNEMKFEELMEHISDMEKTRVVSDELLAKSPELKKNGLIGKTEFDNFVAESGEYWKKKRLVVGGLGNLLMISSYFLANTILAEDKQVESLNLTELYGDLAVGVFAEKAGDARLAKANELAEVYAGRPEVREHASLVGKPKEEIVNAVRDGILEAVGKYSDSPLMNLFTVREAAAEGQAANLANAAAEKGTKAAPAILNLANLATPAHALAVS